VEIEPFEKDQDKDANMSKDKSHVSAASGKADTV